MAAKLSAVERRTLPDNAFVFPSRDPREFPVHTVEHAAASLDAAKGTKDEQAVTQLVHGRYPQLNPALRKARGTNAQYSQSS